jgi:hypothetical protein
MRDRRRHLAGFSVAALLALAAAPGAAFAATGVDDAVPALSSRFQKPFIAPQPRPTETRGRPTDSHDPNRNAYSVPEAPRSPACSEFFCVHWVDQGLDAPQLTDGNGDGVPNYVDKVLETAEHVHEIENEKLGWREPKSDGRRGGGDGKTDIYLSQIGGELFGYAAPDRGQITDSKQVQRRLFGYLVLDNDYSAFEFPGTKPTQDLQVTIAHEYNHILQFGYDAYQDPWFAESTATWMEDQVYNGIDDYLRYVGRWVHRFDTPLTTSSIKQYGSAVWNQWLARHYDRSLIRKAWARAIRTRPGGFSAGVYDAAIKAAGPSDFSRDFTRFSAAVAEWRTGEGFRESDRFPDMPRQGELVLGAPAETRLLNHTTFAPVQVVARAGRAVVVHVTAPLGTASGLALVGRIGSEKGGSTVTRIDYSRRGGKLRVQLGDPGRFSRITAVVVNADASAKGFSARRLDWRYLTDRVPYAIRGNLIR